MRGRRTSMPRKETSEKSEEKERDRGTEGESLYPIPAIDVHIGDEGHNGKQKKKQKKQVPGRVRGKSFRGSKKQNTYFDARNLANNFFKHIKEYNFSLN